LVVIYSRGADVLEDNSNINKQAKCGDEAACLEDSKELKEQQIPAR